MQSFARSRRRVFITASTALMMSLTSLVSAPAQAAKPEDLFKGQVIITKKRLSSNYPSAAAFVTAIKANKTDKVWPKEQKGNDIAVWKIEYVAFFAQPLNDYEVQVKFYDVTSGPRRYVAGDAQMTRDKTSRVLAADIEVAKPDFDVNRKYMITVESKGRTIAKANFWLMGKGEFHSGKVDFSDDETGGK
jgi:hypothetical protein